MSKPLSISSHLSPSADVVRVPGRLEAIRQWPTENAKTWVERFVTTACNCASTRALVLVGSIVRPVDAVQDVDLIYIFDGSRIDVPGRPLDVDLRSYPAAEVPTLIANGHELLGWSIKFGYVLCEKNGYWTRLQNRWLEELPLPSAHLAFERAQKAGRLYDELLQSGDIEAAEEQRVTQLTHLARAKLLEHEVYPASRPELPGQLVQIGAPELATSLADALRRRTTEK